MKRTLLILLGIVIIAAAAVAAVLLVRHYDKSSGSRAPAQTASVAQLAALPATLGHPVYWVGPRSGFTYELTRTTDGSVFIRYLPHGVSPGDKRARYLSVGTYPLKSPVAAVRALAKRAGSVAATVSGGGVAAQDPAHPTSVYLAYPGSAYEVEVFDPLRSTAKNLVLGGRVVRVGAGASPSQASAATPKAVTAAQLGTLASATKHSVYWVGLQPQTTLEQTVTSDGRVYIRYLATGAAIGTKQLYLTIGSYPVSNPVAAVRAIATRQKTQPATISGGGIAVVDKAHPTSVYLAFPGSNAEIEVFDPAAGRARSLVTSGKVTPVS